MTKRQSLKEKEKLFCFYYCRTRNIREAAAKAGYTLFPEKAGQKLIRDKRITAEIKKLEKLQEVSQREAAAGYRRIAYGSVCDAIRLLFADSPPEPGELESLEAEQRQLANAEEIKTPKKEVQTIKNSYVSERPYTRKRRTLTWQDVSIRL